MTYIKNRVLITGSNGFIGQNLLKYLLRTSVEYNFEFVSNREVLDSNYIKWQDVSQIENRDIDVFIHLAGKAHDLKNVDSKDYFIVNHDLTVRLFEVFLKSNADKFIFISSVKATADTATFPLTEENIPNPQTAYGKSKLKAEQSIQYMLKEYNNNQPENVKELFILRPTVIYGPGSKGNLNLLFNFVLKGIPWPLGLFQNKRSFLSIENICFVVNEIIVNNQITSGIYHIADDDPISTNEVISVIANSQGRKIVILNIPRFIVKLFASLGDIGLFPFNSEQLKKLTSSYVVSNDKIRSVIGKEFPVKSREGLANAHSK
jgi:nucleoside-diphosphate-sugar epimerase